MRPYASALRIPVQGSGDAGGMKRRTPEVDAPYGTPLKMYTPFRSNPRTLPALVSTTVAASEATTLLRPQGIVVGCGLDDAAIGVDIRRFFGARAEAVTPAHDAAMPASRVRLPLKCRTAESLDTLGSDDLSNARTGSFFSLKGSSFLETERYMRIFRLHKGTKPRQTYGIFQHGKASESGSLWTRMYLTRRNTLS